MYTHRQKGTGVTAEGLKHFHDAGKRPPAGGGGGGGDQEHLRTEESGEGRLSARVGLTAPTPHHVLAPV